MSALKHSISYLLLFEVLLLGFTNGWDDILRTDNSDQEPLRSWLVKRIADRVAGLNTKRFTQLRRRHWMPDAGYASRGQAGEDVSRRLLAKALAENPFGPGRRR